MRCAVFRHEDGRRYRGDRLHGERRPSSWAMATVLVAMKTVFVAKIRQMTEKSFFFPSKSTLWCFPLLACLNVK